MRFLQRRIGIVDTRGSRILGWAVDRWTRRPVGIEIHVDGRKAGETIADRHRADLTAVSAGGRCAFTYELPPDLCDGNVHTVEVRARGARKPLTGGRFTAKLMPVDHFASLSRDMLRNGLWLAGGSRRDGTVTLEGFTIAPPGREGRITVNGRTLETKTADAPEHWRAALPQESAVRSFTGTMLLDPAWTELHVSFGEEQPFNPLHDFHCPLFDIATPDAAQRARVAGAVSEFDFNLYGYTAALKLDAIAQRFAGAPLAGLSPVLDWGCGCGRVSRFVARRGGALYGADIDAANVAWCAGHIAGSFATISPEPPTAYADNFFGAIYGISVFTHLDRSYERLWLAELNRIARPGALLMLSVHGRLAAARSGFLEHVLAAEFDGFADVGRSSDIDAVTHGSTYYRNVFHQPDYIAKVWGEYFEILAIEEGIVGNYQDLVVARKRRTK
jgi:SAM-dependent methyltransferase